MCGNDGAVCAVRLGFELTVNLVKIIDGVKLTVSSANVHLLSVVNHSAGYIV